MRLRGQASKSKKKKREKTTPKIKAKMGAAFSSAVPGGQDNTHTAATLG